MAEHFLSVSRFSPLSSQSVQPDTRGEIAQLLYNSLELDFEIYCQEIFLEMCNSGSYGGILNAMDSELYHYSLCTIIKSLDYGAKKEIAKIIYSKCSYFDSIDTFNKYSV